jgi:SAM-dependent methyltransferase
MASSPFIIEWVERLRRERTSERAVERRALDVTLGNGRHARVLARAGFRTFGVDIDVEAVRGVAAAARAEGWRVSVWCADLTVYPLPRDRFDLVVVTRYLQRDLFPALRACVKPGGVALYETFTTRQLARGTGPRSPDHLLEAGELARQFDGFELLCAEEVDGEEAVARVAARRRS